MSYTYMYIHICQNAQVRLNKDHWKNFSNMCISKVHWHKDSFKIKIQPKAL